MVSASTGLVEFINQTPSQTTTDFPKSDKVNKLKQSNTTATKPKSPTQPTSAPNRTTTTGKAFDKEIDEGKVADYDLPNNTIAVRSSDVQIDKTGIYCFKPSGIGDSWLLGIDDEYRANAFTNRILGCTPEITVPSTLTDEDGHTKKVEIIGVYAFHSCASKIFDGKTRKLTLTRNVKVIKYLGLGLMGDLEEFTLEEGSVLETIEKYGMGSIGGDYGKTESNRVTLTLPSTLSSVFEDGIYHSNLFHTIIYCGSNTLSNISELEYDVSKQTVVKVSSEYPSDENIFGRSPDRNSQAEVNEKCNKMENRPILKPSYNCPFTPHSLPSSLSLCLLSLISTLLPSHSLSSRALFLNLA